MSADEHERRARAALSRLLEPGDRRLAALVADLGATEVHRLLLAEQDPGGVRADVATRLAGLDPARELDAAARAGIRFVVPGDDEWPAGLADLDSSEPLGGRGGAPLGLWLRGPGRLDDLGGSVAVVGSRSATTYGAQVAGDLAAHVAAAGRPVVSGGAAGIDLAAHRGALGARGTTVAVLACGVDVVYPKENTALFEHLAEHALLVSELPPRSGVTRVRFLTRNRLIAALAAVTVVVEAAVRSGALNTASWAERLSRPVLGVPGPVTSPTSQGVHELVRSGAAGLVTRGEEVLEVVGAAGEHLVAPRRTPPRLRDRLPPRDLQVLEALPVGVGADVTTLSRAAGIAVLDVGAAIERLRRQGLAVPDGPGWRLGPAAFVREQ